MVSAWKFGAIEPRRRLDCGSARHLRKLCVNHGIRRGTVFTRSSHYCLCKREKRAVISDLFLGMNRDEQCELEKDFILEEEKCVISHLFE